MDFEIAIPSYQRPEKLKSHTLAFLERNQVPKEKITIFLKNIEEANKYVPVISGYRFVICNTNNLIEKRNYIFNYYSVGQKVVSFDDDVEDLVFLDKEKNFISVFNRLFKLCEEQKCSAFGVYPITTSNNFYLKERVAIGLQYIIGACYGFINSDVRIPEKYIFLHDTCYSCLMYKRDGKTLRYEGCSIKTKYFAPGGLSETRSKNEREPVARMLERDYPDCVKFVIKRNGLIDLQFKRMKREFVELYNPVSENSETE